MAKWVPWVGLFYAGAWHEITTDVYSRNDIAIRRGKTDGSSAPVPTSLSLTLKNRDDRYNPNNPMSPLWGLAGLNTPLQVGFGPVDEDFEDATLNYTFSFTGTGVWARSSTLAHNGAWSFKSPVLADGESCFWRVDLPAGTNTVSFWANSSIGGGSFLAVHNAFSGGLQWFRQGSSNGWELITVDVGTASFVLISYQRQDSGGTDSIYVDDLRTIDARGTGLVWKWEPKRSIDFDPADPDGKGDAWCNVTAGGLLRLIGQASDPIRSPLYRAISTSSVVPIQWWPLEDPEGVTSAASGLGLEPMSPVTEVRYTLPDGTPLVPGGLPRFQADGGVPGADSLVGLVDGGTLRGTCPAVTAGNYSMDFVFRFKPGGNDGTVSADIFGWREVGGTLVHYTVNVDPTSITVFYANAADDAILASTGSVVAVLNVYDGAPHHFRFTVSQSGGNYAFQLAIDRSILNTGAIAGTLGRPTTFELNPGEDRGEYMPAAIGHVTIWPTGIPPDMGTPTFGTRGEEGGRRLLRFGVEEGWTVGIRDRVKATDTVGPQTVAPMPQLLADIERTEDGILYDQRGAIAIVLRTRRSQYVEPVRASLIYGTDPLQPLDPVNDDQTTNNDVTASNRDGKEYRAIVTSGHKASTSPFAGGVGRYPQTLDVNATGGVPQLLQIAWWWANKGTVEGARHPEIVVDLDADPTVESRVAGIDMGDRLQIPGLERDTVDLRVLGVSERLGANRRLLTFLTEPYRQFDVAIYDDTIKRYDSRTSTTSGTLTDVVASIVVTFTDLNDAWSTVNTPYDWIIEGERVRVTAMGAITGAGPWTQTATVTRSINGVIKAHAANEPVHMHPDQQARYAL